MAKKWKRQMKKSKEGGSYSIATEHRVEERQMDSEGGPRNPKKRQRNEAHRAQKIGEETKDVQKSRVPLGFGMGSRGDKDTHKGVGEASKKRKKGRRKQSDGIQSGNNKMTMDVEIHEGYTISKEKKENVEQCLVDEVPDVEKSPTALFKAKPTRFLDNMRARLLGGRFRMLNEKLYTCRGGSIYMLSFQGFAKVVSCLTATGEAVYLDDVDIPGELHSVLGLSTVASAMIK